MNRLFLIGDSTTSVKDVPIDQRGCQRSWGEDFKVEGFKTVDKALHGHSIRDFWEQGLVDKIMRETISGDMVLCCCGHLETCPLDRCNWRARGSLDGLGNESLVVYHTGFKKKIMVYTFGEYLRRLVKVCIDKSVRLVLITPPPRLRWNESGNLVRNTSLKYAQYMQRISQEYKIDYLDVGSKMAEYYQRISRLEAEMLYMPDGTHTNTRGSKVIAEEVQNLFVKEVLKC